MIFLFPRSSTPSPYSPFPRATVDKENCCLRRSYIIPYTTTLLLIVIISFAAVILIVLGLFALFFGEAKAQGIRSSHRPVLKGDIHPRFPRHPPRGSNIIDPNTESADTMISIRSIHYMAGAAAHVNHCCKNPVKPI